MSGQTEVERIRKASSSLYEASKSVRILSHLSWQSGIREKFLQNKGRELPQGVAYPNFDGTLVLEAVAAARADISKLAPGKIKEWLLRTAQDLELSQRLLAACGGSEFFAVCRELYGAPSDPLKDGLTTSLAMANQFTELFDSLSHIDLGVSPPACHLASAVAERMQKATTLFGEEAPSIEIVDELSANALAGPKRVRIRKTACFTDKDIDQLVQHEVFIHVATSLNGLAQSDLPILAASHPGTTKTQEGLAVFAEMITGTIDLDRFRRLADRVIAVQMAIEGADFLQVYQYFLERTGYEEQAFENARRVFRGGVLTGGAPFTKDIVYLDGLLQVHNYLRTIVSLGRSDCLRLLFVGKLDIEDLPALGELHELGLCRFPKFLPPWASDLRFLVSYLGYSSFLNTIDLKKIRAHLKDLIAAIPIMPVE